MGATTASKVAENIKPPTKDQLNNYPRLANWDKNWKNILYLLPKLLINKLDLFKNQRNQNHVMVIIPVMTAI